MGNPPSLPPSGELAITFHRKKAMFLQLFVLLLPALLLLCYYRSRRHCHEPPSPSKMPLIGNLHQLGPVLHRSLFDMSRDHGPLMLLRFGSRPVLVVSSADIAQAVMKANDLVFASRPSLSAFREIFYNCTDMSFAPYGEHWRQARKLCTVHLLSPKRVQSYAAVREEEVASMVENIAAWSASSRPFNLSRILNSLANGAITRLAVGKKHFTQGAECERNVFCEVVEETTHLLASFDVEDCFPWLGWLSVASTLRARMRRCFRRFDGILEQVVQEHLGPRRDGGGVKNEGGGDLIDVLLSLQGDPEVGSPLSRDTVKAIILDMFTAGTDTTYVTVEWAMAQLLRNAEIMEKVQGEVRGIAKNDSMVTDDKLSQMTYLDAVIKEVLRLHPAVPMLLPREANRDVEIGGYKIRSKTRVFINAWAIGRDPKYWEAPEEFRPERFVGNPVDFRGQDFHYIPFGAGRRMCPGVTLGISTIKLALANLLHRFDWKLPDGMCAQELDMAEAPGLTSRMKSNLLVLATPYHAW